MNRLIAISALSTAFFAAAVVVAGPGDAFAQLSKTGTGTLVLSGATPPAASAPSVSEIVVTKVTPAADHVQVATPAQDRNPDGAAGYVGSANGGVWKTTDGGATEAANSVDPLAIALPAPEPQPLSSVRSGVATTLRAPLPK